MHTLRALLFALLAVFGWSGCFQQETTVRVKADGSGTLEETTVMSKQAVEQMKQMSSGLEGLLGGKGAPAGETFKLLDEKKLRAAAEKKGEGVTFVSAKPITTPTGEGFTAIYAFADVSKLRVDQNPGDNIPGGANAAMMLGEKAKTEAVKFQFTKGAPASLVVKLPQPKPGDLPKEKPAQTPAGGEDAAMMMMQQMFKDMKMSLVVEVEGKIVRSNAEYQDASRVTLMELDFNKVLANPEKLKALTKAQPKTIEETKALVKGVDGIKAEAQPTVTIQFQ
ncbi:MAG TPA: hypothetical protein VF593_03775 [Chthoniobacteraceae bacterium]|jgi:hypothetical protein